MRTTSSTYIPGTALLTRARLQARRWAVAALALALSACQLAPTPLAGPASSVVEAVTATSKTEATAIRGAVRFPAIKAQAAPDYASSNATLTLIGLADNLTVVTGKTNTDGSFVLPLGGFTPESNTYFLLEASRGLNNHAAGNTVARFRTILKWTGSAWTSISGASILINALTTAVAIESSLDPVNVSPGATIDKVSGTSLNASPVMTGHPDPEVAALAASIASCLTNDLDPVGSVPSIKPSLTALQPPTVAVNGAMVLKGRGFSPIAGDNTVLFGTATASVFFASPTSLGVYVPATAPGTGVLKVTTSQGTNPEALSFVVAGAGGASGGSGGGTGASPVITALSPNSGDFNTNGVTVTGTDFDAFGVGSLVRFNQINAPFLSSWTNTEAVAKVPGPTLAGRVSGPVLLGTRQGLLSQPYGNFTASTDVTENFLDNNLWDSDNSLNVVWTGGPRILYDGNLNVPAGTTTFAPPRSILASDGNVGSQNVIVGNSLGFQPGQEIFLVQLYGTGAGYWEFNTIKSVNGSVLTMTNALAHTYNQGQSLCQKVPHYGAVTVTGTLTTQGVDTLGLAGGFIVFRSDTLTVNAGGRISADALGGTGGVYASTSGFPNANMGSATNGGGVGINNGRGGGGYAEGGSVTNDGSRVPGGNGIGSNGGGGGNNNGGGGGYGTAGGGTAGSGGYATGGSAGGTPDLSRIFPGAGGGAEHNSVSRGGNGGGVVFINASTLTNNGVISANGGNYVGSYGGGGSGGSIFLNASTMSLAASSVLVNGGTGYNSTWSSSYSAGGYGRVRLSYDKLGGVIYPNSGLESSAAGASTPRYSSTALSLYQIAMGTVQSKAYDTGTMAPTYMSVSPNQTLNGGSLGFEYSSSSDGVSWSPWNATFASLPARRFLRWKATVSGNAVLNSLALNYAY
ncbi:MAG TPA: IPT/TIG domain-containing protein [Pantanalinema sp.]